MIKTNHPKRILIIVGGATNHLSPFEAPCRAFGAVGFLASFSDLEYDTTQSPFCLKVRGEPVESFDIIYIRLVGKRFEDLSLLVSYAKDHNIKIVDSIYKTSGIVRLPLGKSLETKLLTEAQIPMPLTVYGSLKTLLEKSPIVFKYPLVIKGTDGKQGHAVWSPTNEQEFVKLVGELSVKEHAKKRFMAQEFIQSAQRSRIFVIGDRAVAGITRPTRWRRRFVEKVNGGYPEGMRSALLPIPADEAELAVRAARALGIEIAGVDIIRDRKTDKLYVLEVNSAPRWDSIKKDTGINVEEEIVKYLISL
jgi:RimK family alpha-L-glutamate ligase